MKLFSGFKASSRLTNMKTLTQIQEEAREKFDDKFTFLNPATGIRTPYGTGLTPEKFHIFLKEAQAEAWHASREETLRETEKAVTTMIHAEYGERDDELNGAIGIVRSLSTPTDQSGSKPSSL